MSQQKIRGREASLKRCHNLDWLIEQIRQNLTSELGSVCWHERNVKRRRNVSSDSWRKTAHIFDSITDTLRQDVDVGITNTEGAAYLLLGPATWCCLKQHCLCNVLLETNTAQSRYLYIEMFGTAACRDYPPSYNFKCSKWFLWLGMRTSDCLVGCPHSSVVQISVCSVSVCLSLTDIHCFMELNSPSVTVCILWPQKWFILYQTKLSSLLRT